MWRNCPTLPAVIDQDFIISAFILGAEVPEYIRNLKN